MRFHKNVFIILLILIVGILYILTLAPDVYLEDSGELVTASHFLGIAHPSGYPLYVLLGKLFLFFPTGTWAYRLNFMSAVFGVASTVFLFLGLRELAKLLKHSGPASDILAFLVALIIAISRDFWSQAIVAEVYTLNSFLVALMIWLSFKWWNNPEENSQKHLNWLAFLSGLGMTNHILFASILPVLWSVIYLQRPIPFKKILFLLGWFILGLALYLYIPLRASFGPQFNFNNVGGWVDSLRHILRVYYGDIGVGVNSKFLFVLDFGKGILDNYTWFIAAATITGLILLVKNKRIELFIWLAGGSFVSAFLPIWLRDVSHFIIADFSFRVYYFQAQLFILLLAFIAFLFFRKAYKLISIVLLIIISNLIFQNFRLVDLRPNPVAKYYEQRLESLLPGATYLVVGEGYDYDSELFVLLYLQKVKQVRPDVQIVDSSRLIYVPKEPPSKEGDWQNLAFRRRGYLKYVVSKFGLETPLYTNFAVEPYSGELRSVPNGWAVRVILKGKGSDNLKPSTALPQPPLILVQARETWDLAYQDFLASAAYQLAMYYQYAGKKTEATVELLRAIQYDNEVFSEDYRAFQDFRSQLTISRN